MEASYFSDLINKYSKKVYNLAYQVIGNKQDAEDVVQETFLKVYRDLENFRGESNIYTWIYKIALNTSLQIKKQTDKAYVENLEEKITYYYQEKISFQQQAYYSNPENAALINDLVKFIRNECHQVVMQKLPEKQRLVFIMRVVLDFSYQEISNTLGISENVIKSRLHRARGSLLKHFQNKCQWYIEGDEPSSCCRKKVGYLLTQDTETLKRVYEEMKELNSDDENIYVSKEEIKNIEQIYKQITLQEPNKELIMSYVLNA